MSREVKFRAWVGAPKSMIHSDQYIDLSYFFGVGFQWSLMQYTGLKDKNGVDIYEGDLLKVSQASDRKKELYWLVVYKGGSFGLCEPNMSEFIVASSNTNAGFSSFPLYFDDVWSKTNIKDPTTCLEIKGNIHQNPEILKDKQ